MSVSENNKRIAKNTMLLYVRTFITMIVGLYTSRVMLQALGIDNYGINNVIGGLVAFSGLITGPLSISISRFITYALGEGDKGKLKVVFSTALNTQLLLSVGMVILLEVIGLWFVNCQANIPGSRIGAANWVLQFSICTLSINFICSTYNALIIAHERMNVFAYMSIVDVSLKLAVCFAIMSFGGDRLILLAFLNLLVSLFVLTFYALYCRLHFEESRYNSRLFDKHQLKALTNFGGWTLLSNGAWLFSTQGITMLVNVFFGVVYNAARGIAMTVNNTVQSFVGNFTIAFLPQITKSYAAGDKEYAIKLTNKSVKYTWLLMLLFLVPICMETEYLLKLWLGTPPAYSALFVRFSMFESLAVVSGDNLVKLILADGRIKKNAIESSVYIGLVFPLSWIAFKLGASVWCAYLIFIFIFFTLNIIRYNNLRLLMAFSIKQHIRESILPCIIVTVISFVVPILLSSQMEMSFLRFILVTFVSFIWTLGCALILGLSADEKISIINILKQKLQNL